MIFGGKKKFCVELNGSPALRQVATPVGAITPEVMALANRLIENMIAFDGVGLAANQVGAPVRLVALGIPAEAASESGSSGEDLLLPMMPMVVVNPEIIGVSSEEVDYAEGCLSFPEIYAEVRRPVRVALRAGTLDGKIIEVECSGLLARCLQHEIDHLNGILFVDHLNAGQKAEIADNLAKLEKFGAQNNYVREKKH